MKRNLHKKTPQISQRLCHLYCFRTFYPFHTRVQLVDAEDIANDKIRTYDLTLEVNNITKQLQTQTLDSSQQEHLLFIQPRVPNDKNKPAYKKCCS